MGQTLYVDCGNHRTKVAFLQESQFVVGQLVNPDELPGFLEPYGGVDRFSRCMIASVLGESETAHWVDSFGKWMDEVLPLKPMALKKLEIDYHLEHLGEDRLGSACGALARRAKPAVIIDCGTAITIDILLPPAHFAGGFILGSPWLEWKALAEGTKQLPPIYYPTPASAEGLPQDTQQALELGVIQVKGRGIQSLVREIQKQHDLGGNWQILLTGGDVDFLQPFFPEAVMAPTLIFEGMKWLLSQQSA